MSIYSAMAQRQGHLEGLTGRRFRDWVKWFIQFCENNEESLGSLDDEEMNELFLFWEDSLARDTSDPCDAAIWSLLKGAQ